MFVKYGKYLLLSIVFLTIAKPGFKGVCGKPGYNNSYGFGKNIHLRANPGMLSTNEKVTLTASRNVDMQ